MAWILSAFADEAGSSTEQQIAALKQGGLDHVDLRGVDGFNITALPVDKARLSAAAFRAAGITVNMFGSPLGKIDLADPMQIDLDKLKHLGAMAEIYACRNVRIFSYYNKKKNAPAEQFAKESLERMGQLKDLAAKLGLVLYHENELHIFGEGCAHNLQIIAALRDGKTFRNIFDFDNYHQAGDDVWQNWLALRDLTDGFHLKDSDAKNQHVPIGEGEGQAAKILADAVARKWQGPLILEPHLVHSAAVMATGPSGQANQKFAELGPAGCFQVATEAAHKLLAQVKAPMAKVAGRA